MPHLRTGEIVPTADLTTAVRNLVSSTQVDPADVAAVVQYLGVSPELRQAAINDLRKAREDVKVTIIQRFFTHPVEGTHRTAFDQEVVSDLLEGWFGISLDQSVSHPAGRFGQESKARQTQIQTFSFGSTQFFLYMTSEKRMVLDSLVGLLGDDAVLTTDRTSPPSVLAELVPLWLKEKRRDPADYYIRDTPAVDFDSFYASYAAAVQSALGITMKEPSRELGFVVNGDGLRYHRDRLVNQYDALARATPSTLESTRVVQDLSVVDWDMQDGTFSGTIFVHPLGDRYIFLLEPGNAVSLFFTERVQLPGPMMMPYHCALPVQDSFAGSTAGEATGKRFSCLMRGIADAAEVDRLVSAAVPIDINERTAVPGGFQFPNGMRVEQLDAPDCSLADADAGEYNAEQGCLVTRASPSANSRLLDYLGITSAIGIYRLTKHGDGFSGIREALPMIGAHDIVVINRSVNTPQPGKSYPLALFLKELASPFVQLLELPHGQVLSVPAAALNTLYLSPTAPIFHRSAPLDSFYGTISRTARMSTVVDVIVAEIPTTHSTLSGR
jgi:hypothetical protein